MVWFGGFGRSFPNDSKGTVVCMVRSGSGIEHPNRAPNQGNQGTAVDVQNVQTKVVILLAWDVGRRPETNCMVNPTSVAKLYKGSEG